MNTHSDLEEEFELDTGNNKVAFPNVSADVLEQLRPILDDGDEWVTNASLHTK